MKKFLTAILLCNFATLSLGIHYSYAGEIDILLQKLVEKGVLTAGEAQQIKTETKEQVKKEITQGKSSSLPEWVQNIKFKGDFRLRYQYDYAKHLPGNTQTPRNGQHRGRIRLRVGMDTKINEKLKVGVGIATGTTTDPRSTNITLGGSFSKKSIILDYAYAEYVAFNWLTLLGGKFKNPLWEPGDLIWDTDITPEGFTALFTHKLTPSTTLFATGGVMLLGEAAADESDPSMYVVQAGVVQSLFGESISLKGALSYHEFSGLKGKTLTASSGTNTLRPAAAGGGLQFDYENLTPVLEIGFKEPLKKIGVNLPYLAFFAEFVKNLEKSVKVRDSGWMAGVKFGAEKVAKLGDWQFKYNYSKLGRDAILDILPDSDRYGGRTGIKGHEAMFDFGLAKNIWLGIDYYYNEYLKGNFGFGNTRPYHVLQVDWNMKW
ncbi:MAG: putative porin [Candidatus Omnitrophota bacterium]